MSRPRVILFHNVIAPYRHALFEELAKQLDLQVWFAQDRSSDRKWVVERRDTYAWARMRSLEVTIGGRSIVWCSDLLFRLARERPAAIVSVIPRPNILDVCLLSLWCRLCRVPFIAWVANAEGDTVVGRSGLMVRVSDGLRTWVLRGASGFWSYSQATDRWLKAQKLDQPRVTGTQVLAAPAEPARLVPEMPAGQCRVLFVGKVEERKGVITLVEAIERLTQEERDQVELTVVGGGPLETLLASRLGDKVTLVIKEFTPRGQLHALYERADLLVLPSLYDPWGFVVNEAMAAGTPAIVSDRCGAAELAERAGWVFRAGCAQDLAATLRTAIVECRDPTVREAAVSAEAALRATTAAAKLATLVQSLNEASHNAR